MKRFRVALLANLKVNAPKFEGMAEDQWDDLDSEKTIISLVDAIRAGGHICEFFEGNSTLFETLPNFRPDICFNICEGHFGDARKAQVPAILEMLRIPDTGSKVLTLALTLDKPMTNPNFEARAHALFGQVLSQCRSPSAPDDDGADPRRLGAGRRLPRALPAGQGHPARLQAGIRSRPYQSGRVKSRQPEQTELLGLFEKMVAGQGAGAAGVVAGLLPPARLPGRGRPCWASACWRRSTSFRLAH